LGCEPGAASGASSTVKTMLFAIAPSSQPSCSAAAAAGRNIGVELGDLTGYAEFAEAVGEGGGVAHAGA
jgi:hypothetical protein